MGFTYKGIRFLWPWEIWRLRRMTKRLAHAAVAKRDAKFRDLFKEASK